MGFERHKSTGDMLMGALSASGRPPFGFAERQLPASGRKPAASEQSATSNNWQEGKERRELYFDCESFNCREANNNININSNNNDWLPGNKWSSCKLLGSGPQQDFSQIKQIKPAPEAAACKSAADFLALAAAGPGRDHEARWSKAGLQNASREDREGSLAEESDEPARSGEKRRRRARRKSGPNGARRHPSRVGSLSRSSPLLCRQELSMDLEQAGGLQSGRPLQTKPTGPTKAEVIVVEMLGLQFGQPEAACEQPESFASALSNCCDLDDNAGQMRGVGGKLCHRLEQSGLETPDCSAGGARPAPAKAGGTAANANTIPNSKSASSELQKSTGAIVVELAGAGSERDARITSQSCKVESDVKATTTANKLRMADFNGARLLETCTNWRQALPGLPASSGFYKVAQQQQQPVGSVDSEKAGQSPGQEVVLNSNAISFGHRNQAGQGQLASAGRRVARPGRSPISLQRQTNARLARHRQRIQQQRQEQLAQLAGRSPENSRSKLQIGQLHRGPTPRGGFQLGPETSSKNQTEAAILASQRGFQALNRVNGLLGRLTNETAREAIAQAPAGRLQPVPAIEICDNQRACSSLQANLGAAQLSIGAPQAANANPRRNLTAAAGATLNMSHQQANYNCNLQEDLIIREDELTSNGDEDCKTICSSGAGSTYSLNRPFCKICHQGNSKPGDKLISPCRCSGTMQYIHCGCLLKWLKISNKSNEKPISCELCAHEYTWHKRFNYKHIRLPRLSLKDLFLHVTFLLALGLMLFSALTPMLTTAPSNKLTSSSPTSSNQPVPASAAARSGEQFSGTASYRLASAAIGASGASGHGHQANKLAGEEKLMLFCAATFFISFFLAIYVQTKTRDTLYGFIVKFVNMNQTFYITEYDHGQLTSASNNNNSNNGGTNNNANGSSRCQVQQQYGKS